MRTRLAHVAVLLAVCRPALAEPPPGWDEPMDSTPMPMAPFGIPPAAAPVKPAPPPKTTKPKKAAPTTQPAAQLPPFPAGDVALRAFVDPPRVLLGDVFHLIVEVRHPKGHKVVLPEGVEWGELTSAGSVQHSVRAEEANKDLVVETFRFPLQAFELGRQGTPEMQLTIPGLDANPDALMLPALPVDVEKLAKPDEELEPAPLAPAMAVWREDPRFLAWPPLLLLQGALMLLVRWLDRRRPQAVPAAPKLRPRPSVPPHVHAINQLEALKRAGLIEHGQTSEFVDAAVQIAREYLEHSYEVPVLESTTEEAMAALGPAVVRATMDARRRTLGRLPVDMVRRSLTFADQVKFARAPASVADCARVLEDVMAIIEATRPAPETAPEASQ